MKFVVSSIDLLNHLQALGRVISSKNTLPILDNFLFKLDGKTLEITASDLETTMVTHWSWKTPVAQEALPFLQN